MVEDRDELGAEDRETLKSWGEDWRAPATLRADTLRELRERGLAGQRPRHAGTRWSLAWAAAAVVVAFVAGWGVGGRRETPVTASAREGRAVTPPAAAQDHYMLLLFENTAYRSPQGDAAMTDRVAEYSGWARSLAREGRYVTGDKLADDGRWCRVGAAGLEVSALAPDAQRGMLAGYFVIGAGSYDDAVAVARECPHLKYGGTVEVRRIET